MAKNRERSGRFFRERYSACWEPSLPGICFAALANFDAPSGGERVCLPQRLKSFPTGLWHDWRMRNWLCTARLSAILFATAAAGAPPLANATREIYDVTLAR